MQIDFSKRERREKEKKEKEAFIIARAHRLLPLTRMINDVINAGGRWVAPYGANVPAKKCFPAVSTSILRLNILLQPPAAWSQQNYGAKLKLDECTALGSIKCLVKCETGENVMLRDVNGDGFDLYDNLKITVLKVTVMVMKGNGFYTFILSLFQRMKRLLTFWGNLMA